jgi:hypothetical protein
MFLSFAQTGKLGIAEETGRDADSIFEEQVGRVTDGSRSRRQDSDRNGCSFVDLAVSDPENRGVSAGYQCDGAQYHSSRSARTDRLRQNVLEAHGWVLHRIWSTDWFPRPEEETAKVVQAIEAAKAHWRETDERAADPFAVPIRFTRTRKRTSMS